jgi:hypothetical protein
LAPFGQAVSEEIFLTLANEKKELLLVAIFVGRTERNEDTNLAGSIYVRSSIKFLRFIPFGQQIWLPRAILVSDWLMLNKSPLKLLGQIKLNLAGSIYARSSTKFGSIWPSSFRGEDCFNSRQSEKRIALGGHVYWPNGTK